MNNKDKQKKILQTTLFPPETGYSVLYHRFQGKELGQLRSSLPIEELACLLPAPNNKVGSKPWFDNQGKIALQFLKHYAGCSDEALLSRINTDWTFQLFCGIQLKDNEEIKDKDLIWKIRKYVSQHLDIALFQKVMIQHWKADMESTQAGFSDATCYESYIKYPTDINLLWDSIEWLHSQIVYASKALGIARPRNKYNRHKKLQNSYARQRRKTKKQERKRRRLLLLLCDKLLGQLEVLIAHWQEIRQDNYKLEQLFSTQQLDKYMLIGKIYEQQSFHYEYPKEKVPKRIVSLYKPYLHPIIRGKEANGGKRVEFGAKVNTWMVDGLNFIEHFSFAAFHEGNRLKKGIVFHQQHFGKLRQLGADAIYATNENRRFCKKLNIQTCFKPKGRRKADALIRQQEDVMRKSIAKVRSTVLEGAYGNDKNNYGLRKVKARNEITEKAWIFFAMMTANAVKIAKRKATRASKQPPPGKQIQLAA